MPEPRFRLDSRAVLSEFGDGAVLLDLRTKQYLVLNGTAGSVCRRLRDGATAAELACGLSEDYAVSEEDAARDVLLLLEELEAEGLVCPA